MYAKSNNFHITYIILNLVEFTEHSAIYKLIVQMQKETFQVVYDPFTNDIC